ncbi:MAG: pyridoxal phosphate-dependent aminotransferase [Bacillota bacterium]
MELSRKCLNINESLTLAISAKAKKMKAEGKDVIGFGAGEPDFNTPDYIMDAAKKALDEGFTNYTPASGTLELREEICEKFSRDNDLDYTPEQIIVSNGAKHSLYNTFQTLLNPGDEVLISSPYWVSYPEMVKLGKGIPVFVETNQENSFKMSPEALLEKISNKTKALILNSPGNPTGTVYSKAEMEKIAEIALENNFYVISDEIYEYLIYGKKEHTSFASLGDEVKDITIVINGMSKAYAMTGWRIGYAAGSEKIIKVMGNIQSHSTSNPNSIAQYASTIGLRNVDKAKENINKMVKAFNERRKTMVSIIDDNPLLSCQLPEGAFYLMLNISGVFGKSYEGNKIDDSLSFADNLLEAEEVAVVPGIAFGSDKHVRLSYANSMENIKNGLERINNFVDKLK